jgi:hypothetical protein
MPWHAGITHFEACFRGAGGDGEQDDPHRLQQGRQGRSQQHCWAERRRLWKQQQGNNSKKWEHNDKKITNNKDRSGILIC